VFGDVCISGALENSGSCCQTMLFVFGERHDSRLPMVPYIDRIHVTTATEAEESGFTLERNKGSILIVGLKVEKWEEDVKKVQGGTKRARSKKG
jgi:hypothetical protein